MKIVAYTYKSLKSSGSYSPNYWVTELSHQKPDPEFYKNIKELIRKEDADKKITELTRQRDELLAELSSFKTAIEHVTADGKTRRSYSSSDGWSMVHRERLVDLELLEEKYG